MKNRKKTGSWAEHLLTRLEAQQQRAQDPDYQAKLREAAARPISIMVMSGVFWNIQPRVEGCSLDGVPLECRWSTNKTRVSSCKAYMHKELQQVAVVLVGEGG
jgi:hypothetical protein